MRSSSRLITTALLCLATSGCTGISLDVGVGVESAPPQSAAPPPEGKRLAELATSAFGMAKLAGTPEVSPVQATHGSQWGDWVFCIKSSNADQQLRYAVLIGHDAILNVRSSVLIDGCDRETYQPLPTAAPVKTAARRTTAKSK